MKSEIRSARKPKEILTWRTQSQTWSASAMTLPVLTQRRSDGEAQRGKPQPNQADVFHHRGHREHRERHGEQPREPQSFRGNERFPDITLQRGYKALGCRGRWQMANRKWQTVGNEASVTGQRNLCRFAQHFGKTKRKPNAGGEAAAGNAIVTSGDRIRISAFGPAVAGSDFGFRRSDL